MDFQAKEEALEKTNKTFLKNHYNLKLRLNEADEWFNEQKDRP